MNPTLGTQRRLATTLTFRRIFPLMLLSMVFVLAVRQSALIDPDLWWHLQTGQDIVASGDIPHTDIYSHTKAGSEWVTHEWLSEVFMYGVYSLAGWGGLVFVFSALITLALWLTYRRCEGRPYAAAVAVFLAAAASAPLFGVRPQMLTFLLAALYLALLERFARAGEGRALWWLVPLMVLWVNLHAGFALGLALVGLYTLSAALDGEWARARRLFILALACAAVVPLNPHGLRMFSYPLETLTSQAMAEIINEWASPDFHKAMFLPFAAMLFATFGALALSPRRARLGELFLLFVAGLFALRSARHIPIFALIAAPTLAAHLWEIVKSRGWEPRLAGPEVPAVGLKLAINLALLLAPAALGASRVWHFAAHQPAYEARTYPATAVDFLQAKRPAGPIYNQYGWGGYLIRRLYPDYRVYIDGRADVYGDEFMVESQRTYEGGSRWREVLDGRAVRTVIIRPHAPLATLLREDAEWQKIFEDQQAVIFTRPERAASPTAGPVEHSALRQ